MYYIPDNTFVFDSFNNSKFYGLPTFKKKNVLFKIALKRKSWVFNMMKVFSRKVDWHIAHTLHIYNLQQYATSCIGIFFVCLFFDLLWCYMTIYGLVPYNDNIFRLYKFTVCNPLDVEYKKSSENRSTK